MIKNNRKLYIIKKHINLVSSYFGTLSSIIIIGMLSIILFSMVFVGIGEFDNTKNNKNNGGLSKFVDNSNSIIKQNYDSRGPKIKVYISSEKKIKEMYLEDYVTGVVAGEMPANFQIEALKAQAVAARTYAIAHMEEFGGSSCKNANGGNLCDTVHCQVYISKEKRLNAWPKKDKDKLWEKVVQATQSTAGQVLTYDGKLVMAPYYFAISSGKTEDAKEVFSKDIPYLKSVPSNGEEVAGKFKSKREIDYKTFVNIVNNFVPKAKLSLSRVKSNVRILERTEGGSVSKVRLGETCVRGAEFRKIFDLNSANFTLKFSDKCVEIDCRGYGHGVGMSQWGANAMAKNNIKYKEILKHYYSNTEIKNIDEIVF